MEILRKQLEKILEQTLSNVIISDAFTKMSQVLSTHKRPVVSVSGGKDSDIMVDMVYKFDLHKEAQYIWFDTGLEYKATKDHLNYLEEHYGIAIQRIKAAKPVPYSVHKYGVPLISKTCSHNLEGLQRKEFDFDPYASLEELLKRYDHACSYLQWWTGAKDNDTYRSQFSITRNPYLKEFICQNPPPFKVSSKCCYYAKKVPSHRFAKTSDADVMLTGIRKAEGGIRATSYKSCFDNHDGSMDNYRPLFWFHDADEVEYGKIFNVRHSDCYTVWGLKRTGCVGCPFGRHIEDELAIMKEQEPQMYKACLSVFGESYDYTRQYRKFQKEMKARNREKL